MILNAGQVDIVTHHPPLDSGFRAIPASPEIEGKKRAKSRPGLIRHEYHPHELCPIKPD
jgi:hypothetical protein